MKKIKIVSITLVLLVTIILLIKDDVVWKHDESEGWTVGLCKYVSVSTPFFELG
jgi:hypothetical protein